MKSLVFIVNSLMIVLLSYGQADSDCIKIGKLNKLPIQNAVAYKCKNPVGGTIDFLLLKAGSDSVFSLTNGIVIALSRLLDEDSPRNFLIIIKDSSKSYTYLGVNKPAIKEGDNIAKNTFIGFAQKQVQENIYTIGIMISDGDFPPLGVDNVWQLIKDE